MINAAPLLNCRLMNVRARARKVKMCASPPFSQPHGPKRILYCHCRVQWCDKELLAYVSSRSDRSGATLTWDFVLELHFVSSRYKTLSASLGLSNCTSSNTIMQGASQFQNLLLLLEGLNGRWLKEEGARNYSSADPLSNKKLADGLKCNIMTGAVKANTTVTRSCVFSGCGTCVLPVWSLAHICRRK